MRASQLIHDDSSAQGVLQQWLWRALTTSLWLALLSVLLPSAWSMVQALWQWALGLEWRHWLGSGAVIGLLLLRARQARRHTTSPELQGKQTRYMAQQQLRSLANSRVLLASHDKAGQLIALRAMDRPVPVSPSKIKAFGNYVLALVRKLTDSLIRLILVAPRGLETSGRRDSMYYICAPP